MGYSQNSFRVCYTGDYLWDYYRGYQEGYYSRSLDYSAYGARQDTDNLDQKLSVSVALGSEQNYELGSKLLVSPIITPLISGLVI